MQPHTDIKTQLSLSEIDARMRTHSSPELQWLWQIFRRSNKQLSAADDEALRHLRDQHMGAVFAHPVCMALASLGVAVLAHMHLRDLASNGPLPAVDRFVPVLLAGLSIYLLWFVVGVATRTLFYPWKTLVARDLAWMLSQRDYRAYLDDTERARRAVRRLRLLGVTQVWDNPQYTLWVRADGAELTAPIGQSEYVQAALREVLGRKERRRFRPGRYFASLRSGKTSVTRFIATHENEIAAARHGSLSGPHAVALLRQLRDSELVPDSAGYRYLSTVMASLESGHCIPAGMVVMSVWKRDPWVDLPRATDFYSSASLRGGSWRDCLQRRTKGVLGVCGYLRNKGIAALDFRTGRGQRVRVRVVAAITADSALESQPVLLVDAVEGSFAIGPAVIRRGVEQYARDAGFARVLYYRFPLNRVPERFVRALARSDSREVRLEQCRLQCVDASSREYLDAFGWPIEPLEYAHPRGTVVGYRVNVQQTPSPPPVAPGAGQWIRHYCRRWALWILALSALASMTWELVRVDARLLAPATAISLLVWACDALLVRRLPRTDANGTGNAVATVSERLARVPVVQRIVRDICTHPLATEVSYAPRLQRKLTKLGSYLPRPGKKLGPFLEAILYNLSIRESHLENSLKFLDKLDAQQRARVAQLLTFLWPNIDSVIRQVGLSHDKSARDQAMRDTLARIDCVRRYVKQVPVGHWNALLLRRVQRTLQLTASETLELVMLRPRIVRGLRKPPRPMFAWAGPALLVLCLLGLWGPSVLALPLPLVYLLTVGAVAVGTWITSMHLPIAPGILTYEKTRRRVREVLQGSWSLSAARQRMQHLGIDVEQFMSARTYRFAGGDVRIELVDKRTTEGLLQFLTSSEEIGNCIALRHFVAWCLPSLLDDDTVMLADIFMKGSTHVWHQRGQVWLVAAEMADRPVLVVNSVELNNDGAKYVEMLLPAVVEMLQDVSCRAGMQRIFMGISEYGRGWCDQHLAARHDAPTITKIHHRQLGYRYYFDAFRLRRTARGWRYVYVLNRSLLARSYALLFGALEWSKGNRAKAAAFFDSVRHVRNCWEVPGSI